MAIGELETREQRIRRLYGQMIEAARKLVSCADEFDAEPFVGSEYVEALEIALNDFGRAVAGEDHLCPWMLPCQERYGHEGKHRNEGLYDVVEWMGDAS